MVVHTVRNAANQIILSYRHAFWNITDFGAKCEKCGTINTVTLENGELKTRYNMG
jgi:hypothetical protein